MNIVADKNIPFLKNVAEQFGNVTYIAGNEFDRKSIKNADTLIVRTVTYLGKEILEGSRVKLICSATIGFDHIDTKYCDENGIKWHNAPGCNSSSVMQYVVSALLVMSRQKRFDLSSKTIGIIGVGNVGKKVARACRLLGMKVLLNDPPRQKAEQSNEFTDIESIKRDADIITFHTPLSKEGEYKTHHMADDAFFSSLGKKTIIINSARGGIVKTEAIKKAISNSQISGAIIDSWENEPNIDIEYMKMVDIATPHIAGYSADGKANASRMSLERISEFWNLPKEPINNIIPPNVANNIIDLKNIGQAEAVAHTILKTYNPMNDHDRFITNPELFSSLRGNYPLRREYEAYELMNVSDRTFKDTFEALGFRVHKN